jgi:Flp pilus assembly protein TadB
MNGGNMAQTSESSVGGLVRGAMDDVRELFREEVALARAEIRQEVSKAASAGVQFGIAGVALWFAAMFLLVTAALGLAALLNWPAWLGFAVLAVLLGVAGLLFASHARTRLKTVEPSLPRTVSTIKETLR